MVQEGESGKLVKDPDVLRRDANDEADLQPADCVVDHAAEWISRHPIYAQYNPVQADELSQGILEELLGLVEFLQQKTGFEFLSINPLSNAQAAFASLSMLLRHRHRHSSAGNELMLIEGVSSTVTMQAQAMEFSVTACRVDEIDDQVGDQVCALVVPLSLLQRGAIGKPTMDRLRERNILIYADGYDQYILPQARKMTELGADIIHLDLGLLCGVYPATGVVLASPAMEPYLPVPRLLSTASGITFQGQEQYPWSIGRLAASPLNITQLLRCLVAIRMKGWARLLDQGWKARVYLACLIARLDRTGDMEESMVVCAGDIELRLDYSFEMMEKLQPVLLATAKAGLPVDALQFNCNAQIVITCRQMWRLGIEDFRWFLKQMGDFKARLYLPRLANDED